MKKFTALLSTTALFLSLAGTGFAADTIKLGVAGPHSGDLAPYGIPAMKAAQLVVKKELTEQDKNRKHKGEEILKEILAASGAKRVIDSPMYFGLHLMGGARMGTDPVTSAVDQEFKLRDQQNIFVCDSSIFPNAPGINPALTIMALAHKLSQQLTA